MREVGNVTLVCRGRIELQYELEQENAMNRYPDNSTR